MTPKTMRPQLAGFKKLDNGRKSKRCGIGLSSPYSHGTPGPRGCNESKNVEFRRYWI